MTIGQEVLTGILAESAVASDFVSMLPLTLTLSDYNGIEKVGSLSKELDTRGAPAGYQASAGDITYYAPWGNFAVFYKNFTYASGLIYLGSIDSSIGILSSISSFTAKIELD